MIRVGRLMGMFFDKDPEQTRSNVVIKGIYHDKVWVMYEKSGKDEILDTADVRFCVHTQYDYTPDHSFIALGYNNKWSLWDHEEGFWYECSDPTDLQTEEIKKSVSDGQSSAGKILH